MEPKFPIRERQREPLALRQQAAARYFYGRAKRGQGPSSLRSVHFLAVLRPIVVLADSEALPLLGAAGGTWVFVSRIILREWKSRNRNLGARAQEIFDSEVLTIP